MSQHLDRARFPSLLAGTLAPEEEDRIARHLSAEECPDCERFLESLSASEEQLLIAVLARSNAAPEPPASAGARAVEAAARWEKSQVWWLVPAAAMVAAVLCFFLLPPAPPKNAGSRIKGISDKVPPPATVSLSVGAVARNPDGTTSIQRLQSGMHLTPDRSLVFQLNIEGRCLLTLLRVGEDRSLQVLLPERPADQLVLDSGVHTPAAGGQPVGLPLANLRGRQHLVAVCAASPLALPEDLKPVVDRVLGRTRAESGLELSYDVVTVVVESEGTQ